jgi:hypothetical protein
MSDTGFAGARLGLGELRNAPPALSVNQKGRFAVSDIFEEMKFTETIRCEDAQPPQEEEPTAWH